MGLTVLDPAKEITELRDKSAENMQIEVWRKKCGIQSREYKKQMGHSERSYGSQWSPEEWRPGMWQEPPLKRHQPRIFPNQQKTLSQRTKKLFEYVVK